MKTFAICLLALFAGVFGKSIWKFHQILHSVTKSFRQLTASPVVDNGAGVGFEGDGPIIEFEDNIDDDKIAGGTETTIQRHPYVASLRRQKGIYDIHICGASILSTTRALSAAQCLRGAAAQFSILAGSTLRTGDANAQIRRLIHYKNHPQHDRPLTANDISILFWEAPLTFGATVRPIAFPATDGAIPYGQNATLSGWGRLTQHGPYADALRAVDKTLLIKERCTLAYPGQVTADTLCAGGQRGRGACVGDNGGPLVHNSLLIGINSWGDLCAQRGLPGVYARVAHFAVWIRKYIE